MFSLYVVGQSCKIPDLSRPSFRLRTEDCLTMDPEASLLRQEQQNRVFQCCLCTLLDRNFILFEASEKVLESFQYLPPVFGAMRLCTENSCQAFHPFNDGLRNPFSVFKGRLLWDDLKFCISFIFDLFDGRFSLSVMSAYFFQDFFIVIRRYGFYFPFRWGKGNP